MKLKFLTYSAHPSYGTALPGRTADVPDDLAKDLIDGGYAVDPNKPPVKNAAAPEGAAKEAQSDEGPAKEADPQDGADKESKPEEEKESQSQEEPGKEAAALFGGETAAQQPASPRRRGKAE